MALMKEKRNTNRVLVEYLKEREHLKDPDLDGKIVRKFNLHRCKSQDGVTGLVVRLWAE